MDFFSFSLHGGEELNGCIDHAEIERRDLSFAVERWQFVKKVSFHLLRASKEGDIGAEAFAKRTK